MVSGWRRIKRDGDTVWRMFPLEVRVVGEDSSARPIAWAVFEVQGVQGDRKVNRGVFDRVGDAKRWAVRFRDDPRLGLVPSDCANCGAKEKGLFSRAGESPTCRPCYRKRWGVSLPLKRAR